VKIFFEKKDLQGGGFAVRSHPSKRDNPASPNQNQKDKEKMKIQIGTQVERIASDYTNGRRGEVIEISGDRARVRWTNSPRTWVNFKSLKVIAAPTANA